MNIAVLGSGYVGLVTTAVFADLGNRVIGVDIDAERVRMLCAGESPIYEPDLDEMLQRNIAAGRLCFTTDTVAAVQTCEIVFIAVGTPPSADGSTDLSQVESAALAIAKAATADRLVVTKSTVPVGTAAIVHDILCENANPGVTFSVFSNPEFLREGSAIQDALHPDRVVIGAPSREAAEPLVELYRPLESDIQITDVPSAEMIKYACNAFLATKISFVNTLADMCEEVGANILSVAKGVGADPRIGHAFLRAGIGYGGSCFPKDVDSLIYFFNNLGCGVELLEAAKHVNQTRVPRLLSRITEALGGLSGKTVAVLGLAFKPNTDDLRESRSLELCRLLLDAGATVRAHDPIALDTAVAQVPGLLPCPNARVAATGADAVVLATEWNEYAALDMKQLRTLMRGDLLVDGRNLYNPTHVEEAGLRYLGIGRTTAQTVTEC
ncbi:MAG: UDP-glucose dehydrogenase family protein [Armatimonadota bacterium]